MLSKKQATLTPNCDTDGAPSQKHSALASKARRRSSDVPTDTYTIPANRPSAAVAAARVRSPERAASGGECCRRGMSNCALRTYLCAWHGRSARPLSVTGTCVAERVQVVVRCRPAHGPEKAGASQIEPDGKRITLHRGWEPAPAAPGQSTVLLPLFNSWFVS